MKGEGKGLMVDQVRADGVSKWDIMDSYGRGDDSKEK